MPSSSRFSSQSTRPRSSCATFQIRYGSADLCRSRADFELRRTWSGQLLERVAALAVDELRAPGNVTHRGEPRPRAATPAPSVDVTLAPSDALRVAERVTSELRSSITHTMRCGVEKSSHSA